jgi:hypothetical protein
MTLARWIGTVGMLVLITGAASSCKDEEARRRLDKVEAWIDTMETRANQNLDWAKAEHDSLYVAICKLHSPPCNPNAPPTGKVPPDDIPVWP